MIVSGNQRLHLFEYACIDNGVVLTFVDRIFMLGLSDVDLVLEDNVDRPPPEVHIPNNFARLHCARPGSHATFSKIISKFKDRFEFEISGEDVADVFSFRSIDEQFAVLDVIAMRHSASHPHSLIRDADLHVHLNIEVLKAGDPLARI